MLTSRIKSMTSRTKSVTSRNQVAMRTLRYALSGIDVASDQHSQHTCISYIFNISRNGHLDPFIHITHFQGWQYGFNIQSDSLYALSLPDPTATHTLQFFSRGGVRLQHRIHTVFCSDSRNRQAKYSWAAALGRIHLWQPRPVDCHLPKTFRASGSLACGNISVGIFRMPLLHTGQLMQ